MMELLSEKVTYLKISRLRQFGGTSGHWGGNCVEMDNYDFERWPIKIDLEPYKKNLTIY